jgi:hypothetical protein
MSAGVHATLRARLLRGRARALQDVSREAATESMALRAQASLQLARSASLLERLRAEHRPPGSAARRARSHAMI